MTRDEIIEMAHEAKMPYYYRTGEITNIEAVEKFARLVAKKERQAIWDILLDYASRDDLSDDDESLLLHLGNLIKARSER